MLLIHMVIPKPLSEHLQRSPTMTTFKKLHTALFKREYADCLAEGMAEDWKPTALAGVSTVNLRNSKRWPLGQPSASWSSGSVRVQCLWGQRPHGMEEGIPVRLTVSVQVREMWARGGGEDPSCRVYRLRSQLWTNLWQSRTCGFMSPHHREQGRQPWHHQSPRLRCLVWMCGSWTEEGARLIKFNTRS